MGRRGFLGCSGDTDKKYSCSVTSNVTRLVVVNWSWVNWDSIDVLVEQIHENTVCCASGVYLVVCAFLGIGIIVNL